MTLTHMHAFSLKKAYIYSDILLAAHMFQHLNDISSNVSGNCLRNYTPN